MRLSRMNFLVHLGEILEPIAQGEKEEGLEAQAQWRLEVASYGSCCGFSLPPGQLAPILLANTHDFHLLCLAITDAIN